MMQPYLDITLQELFSDINDIKKPNLFFHRLISSFVFQLLVTRANLIQYNQFT